MANTLLSTPSCSWATIYCTMMPTRQRDYCPALYGQPIVWPTFKSNSMLWNKKALSLLMEHFISHGDHPCGSWGHFLHAVHNGSQESDWVSKDGKMSHGEYDGHSASEEGSSGGSDLLGYQESSKKTCGFCDETLPKVLSSHL